MTGHSSVTTDVFSEYPCLVIDRFLIKKTNILKFMKSATKINKNLNDAQKAQVKRIESLLSTNLHLITVSIHNSSCF